VIKDGQTAVYENGWTRHVSRVLHGDPGSRVKYEIGRTYAVQPGRGKKGIARIRVTGIRSERVQDITEEDAIEEGCQRVFELEWCGWGRRILLTESARERFCSLWDSIQPPGRRWDDNPLVWVIEFELVEDGER
jgi:hypothetical protein